MRTLLCSRNRYSSDLPFGCAEIWNFHDKGARNHVLFVDTIYFEVDIIDTHNIDKTYMCAQVPLNGSPVFARMPTPNQLFHSIKETSEKLEWGTKNSERACSNVVHRLPSSKKLPDATERSCQ